MSKNSSEINLNIVRLDREKHSEYCARLMCSSEPWVTLGRTYDQSLKVIIDPEKETYQATVDDELAGFIILNMKGAFVGYIQTICIDAKWRGKGIGSKLIAFAEARIFTESPNVFMCVSSFNTQAYKLYQQLGYELIGELKDYIVSGHSELLLRKSIGPISQFVAKNHNHAGSG